MNDHDEWWEKNAHQIYWNLVHNYRDDYEEEDDDSEKSAKISFKIVENHIYKFRVQIYIIRGNERVCQKSYGFKNMVKLEDWPTNFKITDGTGILKKSCLFSRSLPGNCCFFQKLILNKLYYKI